MWRQSEVTLIREKPVCHGVGETIPELRHTESCTVKSVSQKEFYQAMALGLKPEIRLVLDYADSYHGEKRCRFEGAYYEIMRTYNPETNGVELTLYPENGIARGTVTTETGTAENDSTGEQEVNENAAGV